MLPHQVLGEYLAVGLAYNQPETIVPITQDNLDNWGVTFYEALEAARHNLAQLEHACIGPKQGKGVYLFNEGDYYDSSRLILLDVIRGLRVAGDYVAMVPNRDTLIVTGSKDMNGLKGMLRSARNALQEPYSISGNTVRLDGDDWVPWLPNPSHALFSDFRKLQLESLRRDYAEQRETLYGTTIGRDAFVASFMIVEHPKAGFPKTGYPMTGCTWTKGLPTQLLPRTDLIGFAKEVQGVPGRYELFPATWDRVVEVMGDSMTPLDIYPQRFSVSEFPTEEQLAAMGAGAA